MLLSDILQLNWERASKEKDEQNRIEEKADKTKPPFSETHH